METVAEVEASARNEGRSNYIPTLDGWRAVAILLVLYCHSGGPFAVYGKYGVDLFFAISGMLITFRLSDEHFRHGHIDLRAFYVRRAFRILPLVVVFLLTMLALSKLDIIHVPGIDIIGSLCFFRNYISSKAPAGWWTGHFWSLSVEEHFYLLWPATLALTSPRKALYLAPLLALGVAMWRTLDTRNQWVGSVFPGLAWSPVRTDYRLDTLLWGCMAGLLLYFRRDLCNRLSRRWVLPVALVAIVMLIVYAPAYYLPEMARRTLLAAIMPVPLLLTVVNPYRHASALLETGVLRLIGHWSFSLYVWQQLFLAPPGSQALGILNRFPFGLAAAFLIAYLSYRFIESPAIRSGRYIVRRRRQGWVCDA